MTDSDKPQFAAVLAGLAATFQREATEALTEAYWLGLRDLPLQAVQEAAARAIRSSRFMPVPAELRELAGVMGPEDRAIKAWGAFYETLGTHGYYASVDFDDPVINATARNLGGWMPIIDRIEAEGDKWVRKDFERVYAALAKTGINESDCLPLVGCHEQSNRFLGYPEAVKPPARITTGLPPLRIGQTAPAKITDTSTITKGE